MVDRARAALRSGQAVYLPGDIPWPGPNTRPGRLLGRAHRFLSVWADLASATGAPVFHVVCTHAPGGRFALTIDPPWRLAPGDQQAAVDRFLARLEAAIAAEPAEAIAHLLWPATASLPIRAIRPPTIDLPSARPAAASGCGTWT